MKVGKNEHYALGLNLRQRYYNLIGEHYSPKKVYIRSSNEDRMIMSALTNAAGMFPPSGYEIWNSHINWQPIPIHTQVPLDQDYLLTTHLPCDRYDELLDEAYKLPELQSIIEHHTDELEFIEKNAGKPIRNSNRVFKELAVLYDILMVEKTLGLK